MGGAYVVFTSASLPPTLKRRPNFYAIPMDQIISIHCRAIHHNGGLTMEQRLQGFHNGFYGGDGYAIWIDLVVKPHAFDPPDQHEANLTIEGYYNARTFYAPKYETPNTIPDVRTTIHWEPNVVTDKNGVATISYYNADPKGKIRVVAEGVTPDGVPVSAAMVNEVK